MPQQYYSGTVITIIDKYWIYRKRFKFGAARPLADNSFKSHLENYIYILVHNGGDMTWVTY